MILHAELPALGRGRRMPESMLAACMEVLFGAQALTGGVVRGGDTILTGVRAGSKGCRPQITATQTSFSCGNLQQITANQLQITGR